MEIVFHPPVLMTMSRESARKIENLQHQGSVTTGNSYHKEDRKQEQTASMDSGTISVPNQETTTDGSLPLWNVAINRTIN